MGLKSKMKLAHTYDHLLGDLIELGVEKGDTLFMHSSFKSLGPVEGGVDTVIRALEESIGPNGLLLMPSFNLVKHEKRAETWDLEKTPSTVGWITEYFRRLPDTYRSDNYMHSIAARGKGAEEFVAGHLGQEGYGSPWDLEPWGKNFGNHSPMYRAYQADGKLLMLGVDYDSSTYIHFVEVKYWHVLRDRNPEAEFPWLNRPGIGAYWDEIGGYSHGLVGDAGCRLFRIREYVDALLAEVEGNPEPYLSR